MLLHRTALLTATVLAVLGVFAASASSESTPEVDRAVQAVGQQTELVQLSLRGQHQTLPAGYIVAVTAMNYTQGHVLAGVYGYNGVHQLPQPDSTPESILGAQAGVCGHAVIVFQQILAQLGYRTRQVQFLVPGNGHVAAEVFYDGGWHWFDPTFGDYYRQGANVLPIRTVRALKNPGRWAVVDETLIWRQAMGATANAAMVSGMAMPLSHDVRVVYANDIGAR